MRISQLWDRHRGQEIYLVGTGPSMKCFPVGFLADKVTIGLNQAWKYLPVTYSITAHPELVKEDYLLAANPNPTQWIIKKKPPMVDLDFDDPRFFVFTTDRPPREDNLEYIRKRVENRLYQGRGIQQTAMNLAVHMGARAIVLVGVDMCALEGEHHGHSQHVRFNGLPSELVYEEYRAYTARVRQVIRDQWSIPVLTLHPFLGVGHAEQDYRRLQAELSLERLPPPEDTSRHARDRAKVQQHILRQAALPPSDHRGNWLIRAWRRVMARSA